MFKKIAIATAFIGALAVGGLSTSEAQAWRHHHHYHGGPYGAYYGAYNVRRVYRHAPRAHVRSVYYGGPGYYAAPRYYGGYSRAPGFQLSIGF